MFNKNKKAAIELSVTTIIVIVIAVTLLILGMVFVRSVMCGAIGLTGEVNSQVIGELNRLFGATGAEVQCIGTGDPIKMVPGKTNTVFCAIKAPTIAQYEITLKDFSGVYSEDEDIMEWIITDSWQGRVSPGDETPKKAVRLRIPNNAPEDSISLQLEIKKDGKLISTQDLDFEISRVGFIKASIC